MTEFPRDGSQPKKRTRNTMTADRYLADARAAIELAVRTKNERDLHKPARLLDQPEYNLLSDDQRRDLWDSYADAYRVLGALTP